MRIELEPEAVHVFLSERNLKFLLAKLKGNPPNFACTLSTLTRMSQLKSIAGGADFSVQLLVTAEPDDVHYSNPERDGSKPGKVHPATEKAMSKKWGVFLISNNDKMLRSIDVPGEYESRQSAEHAIKLVHDGLCRFAQEI